MNRERDIDVLRAHAIAAALAKSRPRKSEYDAYDAWDRCCRHIAVVVCSRDGISLATFYALCEGCPQRCEECEEEDEDHKRG